MAFLDDLQSHCGGLVRLPTPLFWYGGRGWDDTPGRLCLLLDAAAAAAAAPTVAAAALLLIDGHPRWVRVTEGDVEFL